MSIPKRTRSLMAFGAVLVAGLTYLSFRETPVPVDTVAVTSGPLEVTVNADGHAQVRDLYEVASPITGMALRSPVAVGDPVIAGETIVARVQPSTSGLLDARSRLQAEAALQEALAARHVAQADLRQAKETQVFAAAQYDRTQALVTRGVSSLTQLEDQAQRLAVAEAALAAAEARIEMADGSIERARASLLDTPEAASDDANCCIALTAPADGVILSIGTVSERPVSTGTPLLSIGDPTDLELVADILSRDAVRLQPGALAYVERWGGSGVLKARLDRIDPKARTQVSALGIEEQRVDAYFSLTSPQEAHTGLGDGFSVFLRVISWRAEDVVQIPLSAIFRVGDDWAVFVVEDGMAQQRLVTLGHRNGQMTEVQSGVTVDDRVVMHPSDAITTGTTLIERAAL